jgi:hypothetical protein
MHPAQSITKSEPCSGLNAMQTGGAGAGYFVVHRWIQTSTAWSVRAG